MCLGYPGKQVAYHLNYSRDDWDDGGDDGSTYFFFLSIKYHALASQEVGVIYELTCANRLAHVKKENS